MLIGLWLPGGTDTVGWGALYEGTGRQLERSGLRLFEVDESPREMFADVDKLLVMLPETLCYWFRLPVPFRNTKKIRAVLPALLSDWWPEDISELEWRFAVQEAGEGFEIMVCGVRHSELTRLNQQIEEAGLSVDWVAPVSGTVVNDDQLLPILLWMEEGAGIFLPSAVSVPWQWLALPRGDGRENAVRGWLSAIARGPDGAGLGKQLQEGNIYESGIGVESEHLGKPCPPVEGVRGEETEVDPGMFDRMALASFSTNAFDFVAAFSGQRRARRWIAAVGWRPIAAAAVLVMVMLFGSVLSLQAKRASVGSLLHAYREVFLRTFPDQKLGGNLLKKGRAVLHGDPLKEEDIGVDVLTALSELGKALPDSPAVMLRSAKLSEDVWNLSGICDDFGCVDSFRNALGRLKRVDEVKLQNAKQTIDQKAVKFSITVAFRKGGS